MNRQCIRLVGLALLVLTAGCVTSEPKVTVTGTVKPPVNPGIVKVFHVQPRNAEVIGTISAVSFQGMTTRQADQGVLCSLKSAAAKLGANGIVISNLDDQPMEGAKATAEAIYISP